jgi:hypothetical protein
LVGGPIQSFGGKRKNNDNQMEWIQPQPRAKANAGSYLSRSESSWEIIEPASYYQAL